MRKATDKTFGSFLKKFGFLPPNMMNKEEEDEEALREEIEERGTRDRDKAFDDTDDQTCFEITIVNKHNQALCIDAKVYNGDITFNKTRLLMQDGLAVSQRTWLEKGKSNSTYKGPKFAQLSEPVQDSLVEYLYSIGLRPEIGIVIEWLSWNKEQRMYMSWLKRVYTYLFLEQGSSKLINDN